MRRSGAVPGASVVDLNGFGGSTGNPTFDASYQTFAEGNSNYANNPNVKTQGSTMRPQLTPGTCTFNGGCDLVIKFNAICNGRAICFALCCCTYASGCSQSGTSFCR